jgi:hypothetical protein
MAAVAMRALSRPAAATMNRSPPSTFPRVMSQAALSSPEDVLVGSPVCENPDAQGDAWSCALGYGLPRRPRLITDGADLANFPSPSGARH